MENIEIFSRKKKKTTLKEIEIANKLKTLRNKNKEEEFYYNYDKQLFEKLIQLFQEEC